LPTDSAFQLPDVVWAMPPDERAVRAKWTSDPCQLGESYFIRCFLEIPFTDQPGHYGWGVWAQVEWPVFKKYLDLYSKDGTNEPMVSGALANEIPTYGPTLGVAVRLQFRNETSRPTIHFDAGNTHPLALEAKDGMSYARFHEILVARGLANLSEAEIRDGG